MGKFTVTFHLPTLLHVEIGIPEKKSDLSQL